MKRVVVTDELFGLIVVDKPAGITSHDVVARVRRMAKTKRVGHGGTLDPMATGVLPILVGRATRLASYVLHMDKAYRAEMILGITTDTQDTTGDVLRHETDCQVDLDALRAVAEKWTGTIMQTPPMVSAVKVKGRRLYDLAREGVKVDRPARQVEVTELTVDPEKTAPLTLRYEDAVTLYVSCSKGTYVRTLCHDIGAAIGCGAAMSQLRRTRVGPFTLKNAFSLDALDDLARDGHLTRAILSPTAIVSHYPTVVVTEPDTIRRLRQGQSVDGNGTGGLSDDEETVVAVDGDGRLLALTVYKQGQLHPRRVF